MAEHDYAEPQVVAGRRMHGGFLADGTYQPPRTAIRAGRRGLDRGAPRPGRRSARRRRLAARRASRLPNVEQQRVLLRNGLGETFWNSLTIIGKIEAGAGCSPTSPSPTCAA